MTYYHPALPSPPGRCSPALSLASLQQEAPAVAEIIQQLNMLPHPEGGYYKETFRDSRKVWGQKEACYRLDPVCSEPHSLAIRWQPAPCLHTCRPCVLQVDAGRAASTAILYLLPAGAKSKLHRLDASECWHAYLGAPPPVVASPAALAGTWPLYRFQDTLVWSMLHPGSHQQRPCPPGFAACCRGGHHNRGAGWLLPQRHTHHRAWA